MTETTALLRDGPGGDAASGAGRCFAAHEFFSATTNNADARRADGRAVGWFIA